MEQTERIGMFKKAEKVILTDVYWIIFYVAIALMLASFIIIGTPPPAAMIIDSIILAFIMLAFIYLIGLAVAFGTIRAKRVLLKAEREKRTSTISCAFSIISSLS